LTFRDEVNEPWEPGDEESDGPMGEGTQSEDEPQDVSALVRMAADVINNAKAMPLSSSVLISREEVMELLEEALRRVPDEIRQARWLLREREEFLARTRRDAEEILESAQSQAARMVERTEVVRQAQMTARRTIEDANQESLRLRHEAEDFCDQKLAAFEIVLDRTTKMVKAGRQKLQVTPSPMSTGLNDPSGDDLGTEESGADGVDGEFGAAGGEVFFDQDLS